jgi:hypothetical protein
LGRDPSVSFTVVNDSGEQVCNGTFTPVSRRAGKSPAAGTLGATLGIGCGETSPSG